MHSRIIARAAVGVALLGGVAGTYASSAASASPSARATAQVPPCANGQIDSWLATGGNAALGTTYYQLQFTNLTKRTCSLYGFPGVSAVDFARRQVGGASVRSGPKRSVVLVGGATAHATLGVVDTGNFSAGGCRPVEAFGLRVYAPNQTVSDVIPWPFSVCSHAKTVSITIQSVTT